ncbi:MAG: acyl-CoA synthetase [Rhodomicrobium sp.]
MLMHAESGTGNAFTSLRDIEAFEQIPLSDRRLPASTYEMLAQGAAINPSAAALSFFLRTKDFRKPFVWTHSQLFAAITRTANALCRLGIGRNDVVAYVLPNLPETHFVIWGGEAAGIVFAINPLLEADAIAELLDAGRAKWLVTLAPATGTDIWQKSLKAAANVSSLKGIIIADIAPYVRGPAGIALRMRPKPQKMSRGVTSVPVLSLRKEIAKERGDKLNFELPKAHDISSYFCTGGTTGLPKIAARTHFAEVFDSWATLAVLGGAFAPGKAAFCGLPLFHVNAQLVTGLCPWARGAHVVLGTPQGYRAEGLVNSFWEIAEHYRIFAFSGVPTLYSALLNVPAGKHDISSIEFGICGAAPMPVELFRSFEKTAGIKVLEGYGLTESACVSSLNPLAGQRRIGSIGLRLPYQKMTAVILDVDGTFQRYAGREEVGVIAIRGPNVFAGYVNPEHNKDAWIEIGGERWLNTGDLGRQDKDGYFWLTGRRKELIIRGGHNIDPKLIEEALHKHPGVAAAAAVGSPDAYAGEVPVAYVQTKQGVSVTERELLDFAAMHVPEGPAVPKRVRIVPQLPLTAVGKIFKPALLKQEIENVVRSEAEAARVAIVSIAVDSDPTLGFVARIRTNGKAEELQHALERYAFKYEVLY